MRKRESEASEKRKINTVAWALVGGLVLLVCGGIGTWMLAMGGVFRAVYTRNPSTGEINDIGVGALIPFGVLVMMAGAVAIVGGLLYGIRQERSKNQGPREVLTHARILARFGVDGNGRFCADDGSLEFLDGVRYYAQVLTPSRGTLEYECSPEVFYTLGEGMMGDLHVQGRWIGSFTPYIGTPQTHVGQPF